MRDIGRATRRQFAAEEKVRIVIAGLRGEDSIAELCRKEGIKQNLYYRWSKDFLQTGKKLAGDTAREATSDEVKGLRAETHQLKELVAELLVPNVLSARRLPTKISSAGLRRRRAAGPDSVSVRASQMPISPQSAQKTSPEARACEILNRAKMNLALPRGLRTARCWDRVLSPSETTLSDLCAAGRREVTSLITFLRAVTAVYH